jgi:hypothetical protein
MLHHIFREGRKVMLKHVVIFKMLDYAEGADREKNAMKLKESLEALPKCIGEIRSFEVGRNTLKSDAAYDLVLSSEFEDVEALRRYQSHPEHQKVLQFVLKACESRAVVDYPGPESNGGSLKVGVCGISCERCPRMARKTCPNGQFGCTPKENGMCIIAACASKKGVKLCFDCPDFPCETTRSGPVSFGYCTCFLGKEAQDS